MDGSLRMPELVGKGGLACPPPLDEAIEFEAMADTRFRNQPDQIQARHLDFNHTAINDDFSASYKTRIITRKKQNRLRKLDRLPHSLHRNDRV